MIRLPDGGSSMGPREHRGRRATTALIARIMVVSRGTLHMRPLWVRPDGDLVRARTRNTARRRDRRLDLEMTLTYRVRHGRISEIEEHVEDLDGWHAFWD